MKHVARSTTDIKDLLKQPPGTVAYLELEPGAPASRVQNLVAGRARSAGVKVRTRTKLLIDADEVTAVKVIRVEVLGDSVL